MSRPDVAYLVGTGEHTDYRVQAVFAERRDAQAYADHYNAELTRAAAAASGRQRRGHAGRLMAGGDLAPGQHRRRWRDRPPGHALRLVLGTGVDDAQQRHARVSRRRPRRPRPPILNSEARPPHLFRAGTVTFSGK